MALTIHDWMAMNHHPLVFLPVVHRFNIRCVADCGRLSFRDMMALFDLLPHPTIGEKIRFERNISDLHLHFKEIPAHSASNSTLFESLMRKELDRAAQQTQQTQQRRATCAKHLHLRHKQSEQSKQTQTPNPTSMAVAVICQSQPQTPALAMTPTLRWWFSVALRWCLRMGVRYYEVRSLWHCAKWCLLLLLDRLRRLFLRVFEVGHGGVAVGMRIEHK